MSNIIPYTTANYCLTQNSLNGKCVHIVSNIDLGGQQINLPPNVTLSFEGGIISNGNLRGESTLLLGDWRRGVQCNLTNTFKNFGSTTNRPSDLGTNWKGWEYFDTTLNKPIWWTGTKWVDATGADV